MSCESPGRAGALQRRPLATCIAALCALCAPAASFAAKWTVDSCDGDDAFTGSLATKTGTLRFAVAQASDNDTVDLSGLNCANSKISLTTGGYITVAQPSLKIMGQSGPALTIDASALPNGPIAYSGIFYHTGNGTLTIQDLALTGGHINHEYADSKGGCVFSSGNVVLEGVSATSCSAHSSYWAAKGGAVYAKGNASLYDSVVSGSAATADASTAQGGGIYAKGGLTLEFVTLSGNKADGTFSRGGGAHAGGNFLATYTTIDGNKLYNKPEDVSYGGGLYLKGGVNTISASTISGNVSAAVAGVDVAAHGASGSIFQISNSTVSGNHAVDDWIGGLRVDTKAAKFYNSTIAFNAAKFGGPNASTGVFFDGDWGPIAVSLESTLVSNNLVDGSATESGLSEFPSGTATVNGGLLVAPANNLIRGATIANGLPTDTKTDCPLLGRLRDNGGLTRTHALLSKSPAIDSGNDFALVSYDQRGAALINGALDYVRTSGGSNTDIGAYEVQQADVVFNTDFEGCP